MNYLSFSYFSTISTPPSTHQLLHLIREGRKRPHPRLTVNRRQLQFFEQRMKNVFQLLWHLKETSDGGSFLQETKKKRKIETMRRPPFSKVNKKRLSGTLHGFLIISHILQKSLHLHLQQAGALLEARFGWLFSPLSAWTRRDWYGRLRVLKWTSSKQICSKVAVWQTAARWFSVGLREPVWTRSFHLSFCFAAFCSSFFFF